MDNKRSKRRIARFTFSETDMVNYPSCKVSFEKGFCLITDIYGKTWKFNSGQFDVIVQQRKDHIYLEVFSKYANRENFYFNNINKLADFIVNEYNKDL